MDKSKTVNTIVKAIEDSGLEYKILNIVSGRPQHIRIEGFGDIYPSTGTWQDSNGCWHRRDAKGFLAKIPKKLDDSLIKRVTDLEEYCAFLEDEISQIKSHLVL